MQLRARDVLVFLLVFLYTFSESRNHVRVANLIGIGNYHVPYQLAWDLQNELVDHQIHLQSVLDVSTSTATFTATATEFCGTILMLQHPSVYTLGSATEESSGPFMHEKWSDGSPLEFDTVTVDRGGQATYHGPGQIVLYPIIDLAYFEKDINIYLRKLEEVIIKTLATFGITGKRVDGLTGVWIGDGKVAALGIKIRRWVTLHGLSVNVCPDMRYFQNIIPCGIDDPAKHVTTIRDFKDNVTVKEVAEVLLQQFACVFEASFTPITLVDKDVVDSKEYLCCKKEHIRSNIMKQ